VVLIPVGGYYTIDAKGAAEVVGQLGARVVVPMHYRTADVSASLAGRLAPVDEFTAAMKATATVTEAAQTVTLEAGKLPPRLTVMVMKYK
jgi:L-ascorbate metabolism protein UlaG (beta-lactamase superfamily)